MSASSGILWRRIAPTGKPTPTAFDAEILAKSEGSVDAIPSIVPRGLSRRRIVSEAATDLCRRLKAIKRGDEISSAYWVRERLQWRRLVIYHESPKTVEDTARTVLGGRRGDYAEDEWDEGSLERSKEPTGVMPIG